MFKETLKTEFHEELMCFPSVAMYDFPTRTLLLKIVSGGCTHMAGAIEFAKRIAPDVVKVIMVNELGAEVHYIRTGQEWQAEDIRRGKLVGDIEISYGPQWRHGH